MSKMLPIPAPIIDLASSASGYNSFGSSAYQHRRFFIPLIYLGVTASLCYLFLFALVISNDKNHSHFPTPKRNQSGILQLLVARRLYSGKGNFKEGNGTEATTDTSTSPAVLASELLQQPPFHRKTLHSLRKTRDKRHPHLYKNGTWRSYSPKIWSGHQDLDQQHHISKENKKRKLSALTEGYICPWTQDEQCKSIKVQFAEKGTFKPRALVSFPGSGNSWLRYLIERASGYFTGSVYNDKKLFKSGLLGELRAPNDGSTILQKTHHDTVGKRKAYLKLSELMFSYRGILLIRNPYDALVAYWNFLNNNSGDKHTGTASKWEFNDIRWVNFVTRKIPLWTSLIMSWIENSEDYLVVFYEDIQKNPRRELIRILEYLKEPVDTTRLDCLMKPKHLEGPFHRSHSQTEGATTVWRNISALSAEDPLLPHSLPSFTSTTLTISSQQDKNNTKEGELPSPRHLHQDEQALFILDSKNSQQDQQQHLQSPSQTITAQLRLSPENSEEQKEDKLLSLPTSSPSLSPTTSSTPFQHQQNSDSSSRMTSRTIPKSNDNHHDRNNNNHNDKNHLNSSILRLDLIIQDNIDKINLFFKQKSIPLQLLYTLRPSITSYYFLRPNNFTISTAPSISL